MWRGKGEIRMSKALKTTFLIHAVVSAVFGIPLLVVPGGFLGLFSWVPIDPILSRILGAALLALAWSSFRGWQATERKQVQILVELEAVFTVLACIALLRHLLFGSWPLIVWLVFAVFVAFAVAWIVFLIRRE
jgi:hypothetical protein